MIRIKDKVAMMKKQADDADAYKKRDKVIFSGKDVHRPTDGESLFYPSGISTSEMQLVSKRSV